ncbi:hypothetical protein PAMC26577_19095 [Caballeronia sordidicola]|uniref:Uncharacterized protein n=1 Tax=Caballeronia sordidicola TaxID=196367 RepID=A0A242MP33_CABSO|nr:hypothetical protein PAMC26577_19095 [Caballeronia sordidicola]
MRTIAAATQDHGVCALCGDLVTEIIGIILIHNLRCPKTTRER